MELPMPKMIFVNLPVRDIAAATPTIGDSSILRMPRGIRHEIPRLSRRFAGTTPAPLKGFRSIVTSVTRGAANRFATSAS